MSKIFIDQVRAIVLKNISDEKFGAPDLASQLNLSASQTLRKVKAATGKSINQYIRELRLEKAAKLIKKTDLSIAEISYQVGFSSASYFNKTFSKYYGISPGEYKTKSNTLSGSKVKKNENKKRKVSLKQKIFFPVILVLVFVIGYLLVNNTTSKNKTLENSIAVLPFKDFSPKDSQWFSDGVSDNILHSLAQMKDLSVTSFTSSSTFRNTDKQIPEIAEELGVSYILEGSITLYENKIKVLAQLIDSNDKHVWSKEYNENFDDIIRIQNNVAQEVMQQLKITLSPQEDITLKKFPTENMEAYNFYLRGKYINDYWTLKSVENNVEMNKKAIALDSTFAEAYAELAFSNYLLGTSSYYDSNDSRNKAFDYANIAIKINPNTYKAWLVKAILQEFNDWDKVKDYYEKSIAINPNDALLHIRYARYFIYRPNPNIKKYLEHLTIAQKINPLSNALVTDLIIAFTLNNKIKEAEDFLKKMGFRLSDNSMVSLQSRIIAYKNKSWKSIIPYLEEKIKKDSNNPAYYNMLAEAYDGILNNDEKATEYYKMAYELDSTIIMNSVNYSWLLSESKNSKDALKLMESENFKSINSLLNQQFSLWYYYYHQEDYKMALEISKDSLLKSSYPVQAWTYAQLGDKKKVDSITKKLFWGNGQDRHWRSWRAFTHAILKEKDSMYYYLETAKFDGTIRIYPNSRREFDPYRNEERYKDILRDNYLPVQGE